MIQHTDISIEYICPETLLKRAEFIHNKSEHTNIQSSIVEGTLNYFTDILNSETVMD